ncbi:hypothetical protein AB2M82_003899 [Raoultella planticola]
MFLKKIIRNSFLILKVFRVITAKREKEVLPKWVEINSANKSKIDASDYDIPKIIWMYWDSDDIPMVVQICVKQVMSLCGDHQVILLNRNTVHDYIDLPTLNSDLPKAIVADLIRLMLLEKYAGIWMDASIFLTENFDWIFSKINNQDAFLFYSDECTVDETRPISENWFIVCPKNSKFIKEWLAEFKGCILSPSPTNYYNNIKNDKSRIQNLSHPDYLLCYISAIVVLEKFNFNIIYVSSGTVGHYFSYKYNFNGYLIATEMLLRPEGKLAGTKLIKFTSTSRSVIEKFISNGVFVKGSLLGSAFIRYK